MMESGFDVRFDPFDVFVLFFFPVPCPFDGYVFCFFFPCAIQLLLICSDNNILKSVLKSEWFRETLVCNVCFFTALAKTHHHNICSL